MYIKQPVQATNKAICRMAFQINQAIKNSNLVRCVEVVIVLCICTLKNIAKYIVVEYIKMFILYILLDI